MAVNMDGGKMDEFFRVIFPFYGMESLKKDFYN